MTLSAAGLSRVLICTVGAGLCYASFFLYENQQGDIQNRLQELWISIDDRASGAARRFELLLTRTAQIMIVALDRIFGVRVWSRQAFAVSFFYSVASILFEYRPDGYYDPRIERYLLCGGLLCLLLGSLPWVFERPWARRAAFAASLVVVAVAVAYLIYAVHYIFFQDASLATQDEELGAEMWSVMLVTMLVALGAAVLTDFAWVIGVRSALKWAANPLKSYRWVMFILLATSSVLLGFLPTHESTSLVASAFYLFVLSRMFLLLMGASIFIVVLIAAINKLFWPILGRIVYPLQRYKLIHNPKLGVVGVALIATSTQSTFWQWVAGHLT